MTDEEAAAVLRAFGRIMLALSQTEEVLAKVAAERDALLKEKEAPPDA